MRLFKHYISWNVFFLFVIELAVILTSVYTALSIESLVNGYGYVKFYDVYPAIINFIIISLITFYVYNLYDLSFIIKRRESYAMIITCFITISFIVPVLGFIFPILHINRKAYAFSILLSLSAVITFRMFYYWIINARKLKEKVLILGANEISWRIAEELRSGNNPGFEVLGFVSEHEAHSCSNERDCGILGGIEALANIIGAYRPDIIVIALSERRKAFPSMEILHCKLRGVRIEDWPTFYEKLTGKILIHNLRPSWLIFADGFTHNSLMQTSKRLVDILLAVFGVCVSLPSVLIVAGLVRWDSPGSIFFTQERVGQNGKVFTLCKFRTMVADAEKDTGPVWAQTVDPRVTRLGTILRRTGMDELPQLFNVLKGDMSFVGPRPERPHFVAELEKHIPFYVQRLAVKPGITGWAQVHYGYGATLKDAVEKLQYDLYYIKNMSIFLDLLTMLSTVHKVLFAQVAVQTSAVDPSPPPFAQSEGNRQDCAGALEWPVVALESQQAEHVLSEFPRR